MTKVLIVPEYDRFGGTLSYFKRLVEIHREQEIQTAALIPRSQAFPEVLLLCQEAGVQVFLGPERSSLFRRPYLSSLFDVWFCWRAIRVFRPDMVVVSTGGYNEMLGVLALPVPVLFTMHTYPPTEIRTWKRAGLRLFVRVMCRARRNLFLTVSRFAAEQIRYCLGVPARSVRVVYNSARAVTGGAGAEREALVLTIGHMVGYKNPDVWLEVAREVVAQEPGVRFVWLGEGEERERMRRAVGELGLTEQIAFPGTMADVDAYYARASIYFQPSRIESHGIAVIEAMAHGLPCVTSDSGGLPESVAQGETGYTCGADNTYVFVARLLELLRDPSARRRFGDAGQARARLLFSKTRQRLAIQSIYAEVLGDPSVSVDVRGGVLHLASTARPALGPTLSE